MSSDAAAFFANKKKKKKGFKFNANKVDISQITSSTHVDAPEVSSEANKPSTSNSASISTGINTGGDWDESALTAKIQASTLSSTSGAAGTSSTSELLDMKTTYESKRNEKEEIKEKLRVEETKAQLAAAREGMIKQGEKLKEEKELKNKKKIANASASTTSAPGNRFGLAAGNMAGGGGTGAKWMPPHLRNSGGGRPMGLGRSGIGGGSAPGSGFQKQVNTTDEELFPDLATADRIISQEEEAKKAAAQRRVQPAWGKKPAVPKKKEEKKVEKEAVVEPKKETVAAPAVVPAATAAPVASVAAGLKKKPKKKKKKDLSTFKA